MGGPTSSLNYCQHSSRDHVTTQAPPLHQSRDTFGGIYYLLIYLLTYLLTHSLTQSLTPWSRSHLEKLTSSELIKELRALYTTWRFIITFTTACYLSQIIPVHTPKSHFLKIHLNTIHPSMPGSSKCYVSLRFSHQNPVCTSPLPHTCYIPCSSHSSQLIPWIIFGEEYISLSSSLCSFLQSPVTFFFLSPNILNILFSDTLSKHSSLNVRTKFHTHTK